LKNDEVDTYLAELMAKRSKKVKVDADYVLNRLVDIDQMDVLDILDEDGSIKDISRWPKVWRQFLSGIDVSELFEGKGNERKMIGIMKKIKWPDKVKNLEMIGKHIGVGAFKEVRENKHSFLDENGKPMTLKARVTFVLPGEVEK
jgi:phage terminase small subunit